MPKPIVISILNMKGGVGKTTVAVNLAAYLARDHGKRVLLIDLDPQTNASLCLMPETAWEHWAAEHGTLADIFGTNGRGPNINRPDLPNCIVHGVVPGIPNLDLAPSHLKLTFLDLDMASRPGRECLLRRQLLKVQDDYDIILCDCPPNLQTATQNALYASDRYVVPMQPDFLSSVGLDLLLDRLQYITDELELQIRCLGVIFTRVRAHLRFHAETMRRLPGESRHRALRFFRTRIPENIKLGEAPMKNLPIVLHDPRARGATAFRALTEELVAALK